MSLKSTAYGMSYFFSQGIFSIITAFLITITFVILKSITGISNIFEFLMVNMVFGFAMIFYSLVITTFFSDSKLSTQIGGLVQILPLALYIGISNNNPNYLYILYWFPHFPTTVILTSCAGLDIGLSLPVAWVVLIISLPAYYFLYVYLDQIIPDTFGISKSCCFCFKKKRS